MKTLTRLSIDGFTLKSIAIITMLIDHIGAALIGPLRYNLSDELISLRNFCIWVYPHTRSIGRIAFPIFCFLLVEGFLHTKNATRYAGRLFLFAIISEFPFDFALASKTNSLQHQNVYFTLLLGLFVLMAFSFLEEIRYRKTSASILCVILQSATVLIAMVLSRKFYTDYSYKGIFLIVLLYLLRKNKTLQVLGGAAAFSWETTAPLAFLPIWFYNGKRGRQIKYFFYWFYPVHLVILGILKRLFLFL